jgi:hypothetical protein
MMGKKSRHEAEKAAHDEYVKDQLEEAAAHHHTGVKMAHAAGDMESAKKHGMMYVLAMKQLGHDSVGEVPAEIKAKAKNMAATKPLHKFKAHKGDAFSLPETKDEDKEEETKKSEDLQKGALQRLAPFNPHDISDEDRLSTAHWQIVGENRDGVPRMEGTGRARALHKLTKLTTVRWNPDSGEREFLLHRGMGKDEHRNTVGSDGFINHEENTSSWTPKMIIANDFAKDNRGHVVSAWIKQKHIRSVPNQWGSLGRVGDYDRLQSKPAGKNFYDTEHEVVVDPQHLSKIADPSEVMRATNPKKSLDGRINSRSLHGDHWSRAVSSLGTATAELKRPVVTSPGPLPEKPPVQMALPQTGQQDTQANMVPKASFKLPK